MTNHVISHTSKLVRPAEIDTQSVSLVDMQGRLRRAGIPCCQLRRDIIQKHIAAIICWRTDLEMATPDGFAAGWQNRAMAIILMAPDLSTIRPVRGWKVQQWCCVNVLDHRTRCACAALRRAILKKQIAAAWSDRAGAKMATDWTFFLSPA